MVQKEVHVANELYCHDAPEKNVPNPVQEEGVTCAVDPEVIPMFSTVYVEYADGTVEQFQATDTGVKGEWVDIYTPDYNYAVQCGLQTLTVYWTGPEEESCDG